MSANIAVDPITVTDGKLRLPAELAEKLEGKTFTVSVNEAGAVVLTEYSAELRRAYLASLLKQTMTKHKSTLEALAKS